MRLLDLLLLPDRDGLMAVDPDGGGFKSLEKEIVRCKLKEDSLAVFSE